MSAPLLGPQPVELPPNLRHLVCYDSVQNLTGANELERLEARGGNLESEVIDFILARSSITEVDLGYIHSSVELDELPRLNAHPNLCKIELFLDNEKHGIPELPGFNINRRRRWITFSK